MKYRKPSRKILTLMLLACWLAPPASAYTIYLKDGSRILARDKYGVDGDRAIITLENGTETFLAFAEIDVERTEEANQGNLGNALVFEDGRFVERTETGPATIARDTVADLIDRGEATVRDTTPDLRETAAPLPSRATTDIEQAQRHRRTQTGNHADQVHRQYLQAGN